MRKLEIKKDCFIIVRCTEEDKKRLVKMSGGIRKLSKFIRQQLGISENE